MLAVVLQAYMRDPKTCLVVENMAVIWKEIHAEQENKKHIQMFIFSN